MITAFGIIFYVFNIGLLLWRLTRRSRVKLENIGLVANSILLVIILDLPKAVSVILLIISIAMCIILLAAAMRKSK